MRDKRGRKPGSLTVDQCVEKARALIAENGICLFIIDGEHFSSPIAEEHQSKFQLLFKFIDEINAAFKEDFPENQLAAFGRTEKGFQFFLGDASWAGITDAEVIRKIARIKDDEYPELELHYGVAADAWSDGIELIK